MFGTDLQNETLWIEKNVIFFLRCLTGDRDFVVVESFFFLSNKHSCHSKIFNHSVFFVLHNSFDQKKGEKRV